MTAMTNVDRIRQSSRVHGWNVHGSDELVITRHEPVPHRVDVHFGSRGQVTYCALDGRQYVGNRRVAEVLIWLQDGSEV